ncbi:MAG TPA: hypothetical protein PKE69_22110 [Pyrinomonadaceae bacterium]|nr:hypothetical protein [Pyrinomonadaceae bacterium]
MKKFKLSKRVFLTAFVFIMILNISLVYVLINGVFAQSSDEKWKNQLPISVEISRQIESPLKITLINVDNSNLNYQAVNYSVQNTTNKAIRGFVILGSGKRIGRIITSFFPIKTLQPGSILNEQYVIERENIESKEELTLTVDFVDFVDGTFWGEDTQGQSEQILGQKVGAISATEQFINQIERNEFESLNDLMNKKLIDFEVSIPNIFNNKSENWRKGYISGYKSIISFLKSQQGSEKNEILKRLRETKRVLESERRENND